MLDRIAPQPSDVRNLSALPCTVDATAASVGESRPVRAKYPYGEWAR
ncbi:MAG: hypothetical protein QNJ63_14335 [Calothrix sp. MO_192.B10]|nr:hypothetical protein [Calothrix sp. MO_192.B10]